MLRIAENLRTLRKGKDLTQEEAAEMLSVSPQSVSKWERGDALPDITLLPALANLYRTSVDALLGMDAIHSRQTRNVLFTTAQAHMRGGDYRAAAIVLTEALKTFPNDEGILSDLAVALALDGNPAKLNQAIGLCERVLSGHEREKVRHTARAALSFFYLKAGEREKAVTAAKNLPHVRESREAILEEFQKGPSADDINAYLRFIALGEKTEKACVDSGSAACYNQHRSFRKGCTHDSVIHSDKHGRERNL